MKLKRKEDQRVDFSVLLRRGYNQGKKRVEGTWEEKTRVLRKEGQNQEWEEMGMIYRVRKLNRGV